MLLAPTAELVIFLLLYNFKFMSPSNHLSIYGEYPIYQIDELMEARTRHLNL